MDEFHRIVSQNEGYKVNHYDTSSHYDGTNYGNDDSDDDYSENDYPDNKSERKSYSDTVEFQSDCRSGFEKNHNDECVDINECLDFSVSNGTCLNTEGSHMFSCDQGFESMETGCVDVDECRMDMHACEDVCVNYPGSYACECSNGSVLKVDGISCETVIDCGTEVIFIIKRRVVGGVSCELRKIVKCENREI